MRKNYYEIIGVKGREGLNENIYIRDCVYKKLSFAIFYGNKIWERGFLWLINSLRVHYV